MYRLFQTIVLLLFIANSSVSAQIPTFIEVAGGAFEMGNDGGLLNEIPAHEVTLKDFNISETEVTVAQYRLFCNETLKSMPETPNWGWVEEHPIVNVTWQDAVDYSVWLSEKLNKNIKLPTEAQWEYAARGGRKKRFMYSGGKKLEEVGWSEIDSDKKAQLVACKKPNRLGLYDMSGNVWEWCLDWYSELYYSQSHYINPENTNLGPKVYRVARGGAWGSKGTTCTVYQRMNYKPETSFKDRGFRVVLN